MKKNAAKSLKSQPAVTTATANTLATKREVAAFLRVTPRTVENWLHRGLPHFRLGSRRTRFKLSDVEAFLAENCRVN
jgi:excisionase family DNA binding protein